MTSRMKLTFTNARHWINLTLGRRQPVGDSQRRYVRLMQATLASLAGRGISIGITFFSVPLTIGYLGAERYGVWMTISAMLAWLTLADLGMGNGLTNAISEAYGKEQPELAQVYVATTFWLLVVVTLIFGCIIAACWPWINWVTIFKVESAQAQSETPPAIALAIGITLLNMPLSIVTRIYGAYQEGATANYWLAVGNIASLLALIVVTQTQGGLVWLVAAFSGTLLMVTVGSAIWLFGWHKPWLRPRISAVRYSSFWEILKTGGMFFAVQISSLLIFQTDNLIIAHYLGASQVTPYSVAWRLFSYAAILQMLIFPALWPAYAEAFARKDAVWIRRTFRINILFSVLSTLFLVLPLIFYGNFFIAIWASKDAVSSFALLLWMGSWSLISVSMNVVACVLNASGHLQGQMIYGVTTAIVNIVLSILLVRSFGITGVIAATVIAYMVCNVVPAFLETAFVLRKVCE